MSDDDLDAAIEAEITDAELRHLEERVRELEQTLRKARLSIKAAMREPPYTGLLPALLEEINTIVPESAPPPGPPRMD